MASFKCFTVKIKTADKMFAGTFDDVYINLIGEDYLSKEQQARCFFVFKKMI
jgi:hypothetical protein